MKNQNRALVESLERLAAYAFLHQQLKVSAP